MRLRDIAIDPTPSIDASATAQEALNAMRRTGVNSLVIFAAKEVAGVVMEAQLVALSKGEREEHQAADVATHVVPLAADSTIKDAANAIRRFKVDCVPVIDDGRVIGVVTVDSLLELIGRGAVHAAPNAERRILKDRGPRKRVLTSTAEAPARKSVHRTKAAGPGRLT